ncbi:hypothetical protein V2J09_012547 [Rumex salicifolius]
MKPASSINSDAIAPLLPEVDPIRWTTGDDKRVTSAPSSVAGAVFNVSTSIIGAGIMSIPATLKVLGVAPAFAMVVVIAVLADISVEFLLRFTQSGVSRTYAGVMGESFGRLGSVLVQICVMITNWGCLIVYLIIIGNQEHMGILQEWFGYQWWNVRAYALLFIVLFVLLPLVLLRRVDSLWFSSAIAVLLALVFVIISIVMAITALFQGRTEPPKLIPEFDTQASFFDMFTAIPVIVTAFTFHFNVHPIASELDKPSDMVSATRISLVLCTSIYFSVGFFGYLLFGDSIMTDILVNFDKSSTDSNIGSLLNDAVRLSYALHLVLVFPLINFSLRANIDEFLFPKKRILAVDNKRFVSITFMLLILTYLAAIAIPNIWYFFQFIGSTTAVCLAFIFPAAITLRDIYGISTRRDKAIAMVMVVLATVTSIIAIATNVYNLGGSSS